MKKIIAGKKYDTDTAKCVGSYQYSYPNDFHWYREELYQKKTGEFFIYGEGGALSEYRETISLNQWSGGEAIKPLTYSEAQQWAEEHLSGDEYEEIFGEVDESLDTVSVTFTVPKAAAELLRRKSEKTGRAKSQIVSDLIIQAFNKQ